MPVKISGPHKHRPVSPDVFSYGDGCWSYFNNESKGVFHEPVHPDSESAYAHWCEVRREVWAKRHRFMPPKASMIYDGLTVESRELVWRSWGYHSKESFSKDLVSIFRALAEDRAAVEAFRKDDPDGAADVADYLDLWLADLDVVESETKRIAQAYERGELYPAKPEISTARKYGDEPR